MNLYTSKVDLIIIVMIMKILIWDLIINLMLKKEILKLKEHYKHYLNISIK
jgi:hypothetical protein